ncbi:MAG: TolC family protein [Planctomycetaceae bacterium]
MRRICRIMIAAILLTGCASVRKPEAVVAEKPRFEAVDARLPEESSRGDAQLQDDTKPAAHAESIQLTGFQTAADPDVKIDEPTSPAGDLQSAAPGKALDAEPHAVQFDEVVSSVYHSYPMLESALLSRNVALGQQVGASGAFDLKLKGASENGPQGFYQTYRQSIGVVQPTCWGGEVFAGYRIGRGDFQPWYLERQTNDGGEFKAGVQVPLARNRDIDARRAELWKAGYGRNLAEPDIQAQLITFVQEASYAYWDWVAAGENHRIAKRILALAEERTGRIEAQVKAGFLDPPELTDNLRLVAIRQAKVADTRRKMEQTAAKLSVYWRDSQGNPIVATEAQLPGFPETEPVEDDLSANIQQALMQRPELRMLDLLRQQIQVDYSEAVNQLQPDLNAVLWGSQDVGAPTSSKRDKSPYESEANVYLDVPIQRRKARGKMTESQGKIAQLSAKRRLTADKISVDVQMAHSALRSAWEQVERTRESLKYAEDLAVRERTNQDAGASDLLKVSLREQYAVESAEKNVEALKLYFESRADYRAAMAEDQIDR